MRSKFWFLSAALASVLVLPMTTVADDHEDGWIKLFNGESTDGWVVQGMEKAGPKIEDGVLVVGGWDYWAVITEKEVEDFELKLEYKTDRRGNSGILLHTPKKEVYKHSNVEIQINDDAGKEPNDESTGAIFGLKAPSTNATKPAGEWNTMHIKMEDGTLWVTINDELVQDGVDLSSLEGVEKTLEKGSIAIQRNDYKKAVSFRNIMLKPLD